MKGELPTDGTVEAGLFLLNLTIPRGVELTQQEIADACGCSLQNIQAIEYRALKKIRVEFERRGITNLEQLV